MGHLPEYAQKSFVSFYHLGLLQLSKAHFPYIGKSTCKVSCFRKTQEEITDPVDKTYVDLNLEPLSNLLTNVIGQFSAKPPNRM